MPFDALFIPLARLDSMEQGAYWFFAFALIGVVGLILGRRAGRRPHAPDAGRAPGAASI